MKNLISAITGNQSPAPATAVSLGIYDDVLTVLLAQYETNLKTKHEELRQLVNDAKAARDEHYQTVCDHISAELDQYVQTQQLGDMTIEVTKPKEIQRSVDFQWKSGYALASLDVAVKLDSTQLRDLITVVEPDNNRQQDHFDYYYGGRFNSYSRVSKAIILDPSMVAKQIELNDEVARLNDAAYKVECSKSQMNQKERQLRAALAMKKLEAAGMTDLLNDPTLMAAITIDSDLQQLVKVD